MGGVKKAFKKIGGIIGLGGVETPKIQQVVAEPTPVAVSDVSADTGSETTKKKKKRGFTATQVATIAGNSVSDDTRKTLG